MPAGLITGLRGVDLGVPDVAAHARFYVDTWRLTLAAERKAAVYLRGSGAYCHILALHPRARPELLCINLAAEGARHADARCLPDRPPWPGSPTDRMKAAQKKIGFAERLFRP